MQPWQRRQGCRRWGMLSRVLERLKSPDTVRMMPGEIRLFDESETDAAITWAAG